MGPFADLLRAILNEQSISQAALARRIGVSAQAVSGWFAAGNTPSRENVVRVEAELGVEPRGSLLTAAGYAVGVDTDHTVESLLRADPGLDPEDKRALLRLLATARDRFARRDLPAAVRLEGELRGLRDDLKDAKAPSDTQRPPG